MTLATPERRVAIFLMQALNPNPRRSRRRASGLSRSPTWPARRNSTTMPTTAPITQPPVFKAQEAFEGLAQFLVE